MVEPPQQVPIPARYEFGELVGQLRRQYPVAIWKDARDRQVVTANAETLLQAIEDPSSDWADRAVGYHLLTTLPLSPLERARAGLLLVEALKQPNEGKASLLRIARVSAAALVGWLVVLYFLGGAIGSLGIISCGGAIFWTVLTTPVVLGYQNQKRANILQRVAATALAQVGNPDSIAVLYQHVRVPSIHRKEALQALRAILPRVTAAWYGHLPVGAAEALTGLAGSSEEDLALAALAAIEQAGDGNCTKAVERIAAHAGSDRVCQQAIAILPTLMARRENEKSAAILLRPSDNNRTEHLVRPVYGGDPDVANLLRASNAESSEALPDNREH